MTHKTATKRVAGFTQIRNAEIYFYRIVLSGTVLDAVAEGIFTRIFFFFLTWNEVNREFWQE